MKKIEKQMIVVRDVSSNTSQLKQSEYKMYEVSLFLSNRGIRCQCYHIESLSQLALKRNSIKIT